MAEKYTPEIVIRPKTGWFELDIAEVWRYRDLITMFVRRNFVLLYKQTILGPLWLIINPLMTSIIFTFVFGNLAQISTDGVPHILFYMAGNTIWGLFSACVTGTATVFTSNANVFGKIYFPRLTVPISQTITALLNFAVQFVVLALIFAYFAIMGEVRLSLWMLLIPLLLLQSMLLGLGAGVIVSSLTTKYRDLAIAVGFGMQLWMYASPVVYPMSTTSGMMRTALLINPLSSVINNFRYAFLGSGELLIGSWIGSWGWTLGFLMLGILLFNRVEKTFMDTV